MAFVGLFLMYAVFYIILGAVLLVSATIFLIISVVMKRRYNKKLAEDGKKPGKMYLVFRWLAILNYAPVVCIVIILVVSQFSEDIKKDILLSNKVMSGDYEQAENLLQKGVNPDCTLESNRPAKNGEKTLFMELCMNYGFTDDSGDPVDYEFTKEELEMMELLIEYGADINAVCYEHEKGSLEHFGNAFSGSDRCGYTPFLYSVRNADTAMVKWLIGHGADVHVTDYCGYNAVATVADNLDDENGLEILKILVENGVDIYEKTNYGRYPQWLAYRQTTGQSPLDNDEIRKIIGEY